MAQKVIVELVDDLDGTVSEDISTVTFALDGVSYEIDLLKTMPADSGTPWPTSSPLVDGPVAG